MSSHLFSSLNLRDELVSTIDALGFEAMTSIQQQSLPLILAGEDVIAQGHTGSGKTAAFGIGLLNSIKVGVFKPQALILCPTRELSEQVATEVRRLARAIANVKVITVYGGTSIKAQIDSLAKGAHIVVGTPGRIEDLLAKDCMDLASMNTLVLDEADRMLDMGFQKTLDTILELMPKERQTLLFSATFPKQIDELAKRVTQGAQHVSVLDGQDQVRIDERFYEVENDNVRQDALALLLHEHASAQTVVFCNTRADAQSVVGALKSIGFSAAALHGDMEQKDRDQTLIRFSNGSLNVLVATDVAARGLDITSLELVINFHLPKEIEIYTHRIGRTGRAGEKGTALSLFHRGEQYRMEKLATLTGRKTTNHELPPKQLLAQTPPRAAMSTLRIEGGKRQKLRPGDLVGALTKKDEANADISGAQLGKIQMLDNWAYIAVERDIAKQALNKLTAGKIKGKSFRCRLI